MGMDNRHCEICHTAYHRCSSCGFSTSDWVINDRLLNTYCSVECYRKYLNDKIEGFRELNFKGWDSYDAEPISEKTILFALETVHCLYYGYDWFPAPLSNGGIRFEAGDRIIDIETIPDKER